MMLVIPRWGPSLVGHHILISADTLTCTHTPQHLYSCVGEAPRRATANQNRGSLTITCACKHEKQEVCPCHKFDSTKDSFKIEMHTHTHTLVLNEHWQRYASSTWKDKTSISARSGFSFVLLISNCFNSFKFCYLLTACTREIDLSSLGTNDLSPYIVQQIVLHSEKKKISSPCFQIWASQGPRRTKSKNLAKARRSSAL